MIIPDAVIDMTGSSSIGIVSWAVESGGYSPGEGVVSTRELWDELHTQADPTQEWFDDWVRRIPNISCGCRKWVLEYIAANTPQFDDELFNFLVWGWRLHNAVNAKLRAKGLDRPEFPWSEFTAMYINVQPQANPLAHDSAETLFGHVKHL